MYVRYNLYADAPTKDRYLPQIDLPQGPIHYDDTGGDGPVLVFVHGLLADASLWDGVVTGLRGQTRCLTPTWPLGSHSEPMQPGTDLSPRGIAEIISTFLEAMELTDVVVVANDTSGAIAQPLVTEHPRRIGRLVLTPCEAFENFLPPMFRPYQWLAHVPAVLSTVLQTMRVRPLRRLPMAYRRIAKHGVAAAVSDRWLAPALAHRAIRRDVAAFLRGIDARDTLEAAERLPGFDRPTLILWPREERSCQAANRSPI